eukprot:g11107.t1
MQSVASRCYLLEFWSSTSATFRPVQGNLLPGEAQGRYAAMAQTIERWEGLASSPEHSVSGEGWLVERPKPMHDTAT